MGGLIAAIHSLLDSSGVDATIGGGGGTENDSAEAAAAKRDDALAWAERRLANACSTPGPTRWQSAARLGLGEGAGTGVRAACRSRDAPGVASASLARCLIMATCDSVASTRGSELCSCQDCSLNLKSSNPIHLNGLLACGLVGHFPESRIFCDPRCRSCDEIDVLRIFCKFCNLKTELWEPLARDQMQMVTEIEGEQSYHSRHAHLTELASVRKGGNSPS